MIEFDDKVKEILGRPNFACGRIAEKLRQKGFEIECKAEAEQARVLYWMLEMYEKHGADWKTECNNYLKS